MRPLLRATPLIGWLLYAGIAQATPVIDQEFNPPGNFAALAVANDRNRYRHLPWESPVLSRASKSW